MPIWLSSRCGDLLHRGFDRILIIVVGLHRDEGAPLASDLESHTETDRLALDHGGETAGMALLQLLSVLTLGMEDPAAALFELLDGLAGCELVDRLGLFSEDCDGDFELQRALGRYSAKNHRRGSSVPHRPVWR